MSEVRIRPAEVLEARLIGRMFQIASAGLADYTWTQAAAPGEDLLDVAERRFRRTNTDLSYENAYFAEAGGEVAGMVHAFPLPQEVLDPAELAAMDPVLRPLAELEVPGSFYIAALAVLPPWRRRGIGARLIGFAEALGQEASYKCGTITVYEANAGALCLYRRLGCQEVGRRPLVQHPLFTVEGDVLMLAKRL